MIDDQLPPLPGDVLALLDAERAAQGPAPEAQERMLAAIAVGMAAPLAPIAVGKAAALAKGGAAGAKVVSLKLAAVIAAASLAAGGAGGAAIHAAVGRTAPATAPIPAAPPPIAAPPALQVVPAPPAPAEAPVPAPAPPRPTRRPASDADLAAERQLLEVARAALSRGDGAGALAPLERHAARWPRGALAEERESLRVQSLAAAGRFAEARERGAQFRQHWPHSLLLPAVEETLKSIP